MKTSIWKSVILSVALILAQQGTCHAATDDSDSKNPSTTRLIVIGSILGVTSLVGTTMQTLTHTPKQDSLRREVQRQNERDSMEMEEQKRIAVNEQKEFLNTFLSKLPSDIAIINLGSVSETKFEDIEAAFANDGRFVVKDRNSLEKIRKEQRLQSGGEIDEQSAVEAGKLLGAKAIIFAGSSNSRISVGSIYPLDYKPFSNTSQYFRAVNTEDGRVLAAFSKNMIDTNLTSFVKAVKAKLPKNSTIAISASASRAQTFNNCLYATKDSYGRVTRSTTINQEYPACKDDAKISNYEIVQTSIEGVLANSGFNVVDRSTLDKIRQEQNLQTSGEFDENAAVSVGKISGASVLIDLKVDYVTLNETASIAGMGFTVKAIDIKTGSILFAKIFN